MSNRFICGFENMSGLSDAGGVFYEWGSAADVKVLGTTNKYLRNFNSEGPSLYFSDAPATIITGFRFWIAGDSYTGANLMNFYDGGTAQITLGWAETGAPRRLRLMRGATQLAIGTRAFQIGVWDYIEIKVVCHPTAGRVEIRVNGVPEITFTGNTSATGAARIDRVRIGNASIKEYFYDDWYINDGAGSEHNDFEGDVAILAALPNAAGNYSQFTPTPAVPNWQNVDEATSDGDTSYNTGTAAGQKDSYKVAAVAGLRGQIRVVQATAMVRKDDAGLRQMRAFIRSGASEVSGPTLSLNASYAAIRATAERDPATGNAWDAAGVGALEIGAEVVL